MAEEEGERRKGKERIRGPLSPAWRPSQRGGRGRAAWLYSQPGDTRSPSARPGPEPEQGKPAYKKERDTERGRQREHAGRQAMCKEKDSYRLYPHPLIQPCTRTPTQTGGGERTAEGFIREKTYVNKYLHNRDILRRKAATSREMMKLPLVWV